MITSLSDIKFTIISLYIILILLNDSNSLPLTTELFLAIIVIFLWLFDFIIAFGLITFNSLNSLAFGSIGRLKLSLEISGVSKLYISSNSSLILDTKIGLNSFK